MREIKFRAWDSSRGCYYEYTDDLFVSLSGKVFENEYDEYEDGSPVECHNGYEIEQFTGLLDKNGKEIYEGDIAKPWGSAAVMKYIPTHCRFMWTRPVTDVEFVYDPQSTHEVIGNVHENTELLEKE